MYQFIKHKFLIYTIITSSAFIGFIFVAILLPTQHIQAANSNLALCFYSSTGTLYNCNDVSPSETNLVAGDCYTSANGAVTSVNGQQQLVWKSADCSGTEFQGTTFPDCQAGTDDSSCCMTEPNNSNSCALPVSSDSQALTTCSGGNSDCQKLVGNYLNPIIDFLAAGVGLLVTIMIVVGGIQYITSQDNPQAVSAARNRIFNAVVALVIFALMYSLLQWLVPGGIFNK